MTGVSLCIIIHSFVGISPKEGAPGTLITIRGENLGLDRRDLLSVKICGVEMLLTADWISCNKITARSGRGIGMCNFLVFLC